MKTVRMLLISMLPVLCLLLCGCRKTPAADAASLPAGHILVIDAGHGGEDGGAQSASGILESDVNLDIALRLEALARFCGTETRMTRKTREIEYPPELTKTSERKTYDQKQRVRLIRETPDAVLISIHQNKYPDPRPRGPQVLYAEGEDSKALGELTHEMLTQAVYPQNRRVAAPISKNIYLTRMADCPAILVECGFLSNAEEAALLTTPQQQTRIACTLLCAYLQYFQTVRGT